jgi:hypothetical protein
VGLNEEEKLPRLMEDTVMTISVLCTRKSPLKLLKRVEMRKRGTSACAPKTNHKFSASLDFCMNCVETKFSSSVKTFRWENRGLLIFLRMGVMVKDDIQL